MTYRNPGPPVNTGGEPIDTITIPEEQVLDFDLPLVDEEIGRDHQTSHRPKEDSVAAKDCQKRCCGVDQFPRIGSNGEKCGQVCTTADVHISRKCCGEVETWVEPIFGELVINFTHT